MRCIEVIKEYLEKNGFDGLYNNDNECGCELPDLAPCMNDISQCEVGYKIIVPEDVKGYVDYDFYISNSKDARPWEEG